MKLKVQSHKTVADLKTLLAAKTPREIKLALEGYTRIPVNKPSIYAAIDDFCDYMRRGYEEARDKSVNYKELYSADAHQRHLDRMAGEHGGN